MFRRKWSGLPKDPEFPSDLAELGYFINNVDEIRSIDDPKSYFKFFITKNERWNERQRFAMNHAVEKIVHQRLESEGLVKITLPLGTTALTQPHLPVFVSPNLAKKPRVVVIFGEAVQDLGIIAHRVIGGHGGVNKGSMVSVVQALKAQQCSSGDPTAPGIILANPGQTWWWPEGKRALSPSCRHSVPMASAVHWGRYYDPKRNAIPENRTAAEHIRYMFDKVIPSLATENVVLDVIAVGDAADHVEAYLDQNWATWSSRMNCLAILGGFTNQDDLCCDGFKKFLRERARAWIQYHEPLDFPVSGPDGNPKLVGFTNHGCPVLSAGDALIIETMLIEVRCSLLAWMNEVVMTPGYTNPHMEITTQGCIDEGPAWGAQEETASAAAASGGKSEARDDKGGEADAGVEQKHEPAQEGNCAEAPVVDGAKVTALAKSKENETSGNIETTLPAANGPSQAGEDKQVLTLRSKEKHVAAEKAALKREDKQASIGASSEFDRATEASDGDAGRKDAKLNKPKDPVMKEGALAKDMVLQYLARAEEAATRLLELGLGQGQGQADDQE